MSLNTILATAPLTTTNYVIKATGTALGNSLIWDNGTNVGIGNTNTSYTLDVSGTGRFTGALITNSTSFPLDIYGTTNNYGLRINNVQAATLFLYSSNANAASRNWGLFTNSEVYGDFDIRQSNAINGDLTNGANSTSRFYIKNNGNVGIGFTSPGAKLEVQDGASVEFSGTGYRLAIFSSTSAANADRPGITIGYDSTGGGIIAPATQSGTTNFIGFWTYNSGWSEKMRIKGNGDVAIGTTPTANGHNFFMEGGNGAYQTIGHPTGTGTGYSYTLYFYGSGVIGGISQLGTTAIVYNTTSDYRLKENVLPIENGIEKVLSIKPVSYKWKNTEDEFGEGFIAHELQDVIPYAVTGEKDAINEDGSFKLQQVDYSKVVPTLVKAVQEQQALITSLQEQINAIVATKI